MVGEQDLEQRNAAPVLGIRMANARCRGVAQAFTSVFAVASAGGAGNIVLGRIGEDGKLLSDSIVHRVDLGSQIYASGLLPFRKQSLNY